MCSFCTSTWRRSAIAELKEHESPQAYGEVSRVTLAQIIVFNRRCAGKVSKIPLESFKKRDQTELHSDVAASLSPFEQKLAQHFSRVEMIGKRGRKVAVLLNREAIGATTLLVAKEMHVMCIRIIPSYLDGHSAPPRAPTGDRTA